jgi:hypothetical protein
MVPSPCGAVAVAAILGLPVTVVVADGFLAPRRPVWATSADDLEAAFRRFGYRMRLAGGFHDGCPPLMDWLEYDRERCSARYRWWSRWRKTRSLGIGSPSTASE